MLQGGRSPQVGWFCGRRELVPPGPCIWCSDTNAPVTWRHVPRSCWLRGHRLHSSQRYCETEYRGTKTRLPQSRLKMDTTTVCSLTVIGQCIAYCKVANMLEIDSCWHIFIALV
ncbi:unnamed protein product [Ixodes persulcatus]